MGNLSNLIHITEGSLVVRMKCYEDDFESFSVDCTGGTSTHNREVHLLNILKDSRRKSYHSTTKILSLGKNPRNHDSYHT